MQEIIEKIFSRYGEDIIIDPAGDGLHFRGVFQHTGSKDWHNMEKTFSLLGQIPRGQYLVLAPVQVELNMGDKLQVNARRFAVRRVESVNWKNQMIYKWGLCVELGGDDTWPV